MTTNSLIHKLRRRIKDDRPVYAAMTVNVTDTNISRAIAELNDGRFTIVMEGVDGPNVELNLSEFRYGTVGRLALALNRIPGVVATLNESASADHSALDIYPIAPTDISGNNNAVELKYRLFSDEELDEIISQAIQRHNPSFSVQEVPTNEEVFILTLAHAEVCRHQAYDATKRQGEDETPGRLLDVAKSFEDAYDRDVKRLSRALISPQEATPNTMGPGDIVIGTAYRASLRTGRRAPFGAQSGPTPPILLEPDDIGDMEDESVVVRWLRNADNDFYRYELWVDTVPEVIRSHDARAGNAQNPDYPVYYHYEGLASGTSKRVFQIHGGRGSVGQGQQACRVTDLEPNCNYFFRLFVQDTEGSSASSQVVGYRTKELRTRFSQINPLSHLRAVPGTVVTLYFNPKYGPVTEQHKAKVSEYDVPLAVIDNFTATVTIPPFSRTTTVKSIVIRSPNGLLDICPVPFQVL